MKGMLTRTDSSCEHTFTFIGIIRGLHKDNHKQGRQLMTDNTDTIICPNCGEIVTENQTSCANCGRIMSATNETSADQKQDLLEKQQAARKKTLREVLIFGGFLLIALILFLFIQNGSNTFTKLSDIFDSAFEKKKTILLEPDCLKTQSCDAQILKETAAILQERARALGFAGTTVKVNTEQMLEARVKESVEQGYFYSETTKDILLEFVDFGKTAFVNGTMVTTDYPEVPETNDDTQIWHTVFTEKDIAKAEASAESFGANQSIGYSYTQYFVTIEFTEAAADGFAEFTQNHVGDYLGIVINKEVYSCPFIQSPITGGIAMISGDFSEEEAKAFAVRLNTGHLPYIVSLYEIE